MISTAEELYSNIERLFENVYNLLNGFQQASISNGEAVEVDQKLKDGTITKVRVNSFQQLQNELTRIDANFKAITNADNISYMLNGDGSLSQLTKTSFMNAEYLSGFSFSAEAPCLIDKTSVINDLIFPNVKLPITIDSTLLTDVRSVVFEITSGWESIPENPQLINIRYLLSKGIITANEIERTLSPEKEKVTYFGKFTVIDVEATNNIYSVHVNDTKYSSVNSIGLSIDLKIDDILVNKAGTAKFQITYIDKFNRLLKLTRIAGSDTIKVGIDELYFNEILAGDNLTVGIPVQPNKKLVVFLSTENIKTVGFPSIGIKIDTSAYTVLFEDSTYTLDEFFTKYVTNISEYLVSLTKETSIPYSLGVAPQKPVVSASNFKVVQINKHLTTAKSVEEIAKLNESKQKIKDDIQFREKTIETIQNAVDTLQYKTVESKNENINKIKSLRNEINTLNNNLLTITRNLDANALTYGLKGFTPKYRVLGSWNIQPPIYSPLTKAQNVIGYQIQYRYLSKALDTIDSTSLKMISDGKEINVVFSPWVDAPSRMLTKVSNINGELVWETPILDSVDDININQCSIAIKEGESVEIKIRAISEAGYPISPIKSEWSEILRVDFPAELTTNNVATTVAQNESDLRTSELTNLLQKSGVLDHLNGAIKEGEATFSHQANQITSGQYTSEQKNIPLDVAISNLYKEINILKNTDVTNNIVVSVVDFNNESFTVTNNTTLELFAGNYSDNFNLLDSTKFGSIIRKQGFIKIKNNNTIPIELKTLVPGVAFDETVAPIYYNVPVKSGTALVQTSKQILYFRNLDLTNQNEDIFKLVKPKLAPTTININALYIDDTALEVDKNIVYADELDNVKICKLKPLAGTTFNAFTKEHPIYDSNDKALMLPHLQRLAKYTANLKALNYQSETDIDDIDTVGFRDADVYAIGENTCGAFLYPMIVNANKISVVGNSTISTLIIQKESEILIPFVYEFRMTDRLGLINGRRDLTINTELIYAKKLGVDMMINNSTFKFDILVSSKLKSKVTPIDSLNVKSVLGAFTNETPGQII